jgi:hypothetical protein
MKHILFFMAFMPAIILFSCKNTSEKSASDNPNGCNEYACPMHPDHTSTVPAKCSECNMEMEAVKDSLNKDTVSVH